MQIEHFNVSVTNLKFSESVKSSLILSFGLCSWVNKEHVHLFSIPYFSKRQTAIQFVFLFTEAICLWDRSTVRRWHCDNFVLCQTSFTFCGSSFERNGISLWGKCETKHRRSGKDGVKSSPLSSLYIEEKDNHGYRVILRTAFCPFYIGLKWWTDNRAWVT